MHAVVAEGKERERLFNQHANQVPVNVEYQKMAGRQIPIVILEPIVGDLPGQPANTACSGWAALADQRKSKK